MKSTPPASAVNHVVLDAALAREEPHRFAALLGQFASGYHEHFSADEAEPAEAWAARIEGIAPPQPAMRVAVAVESVDGDERVIGGAAAEYYGAAGCALVTYLFVNDAGGHRQRGHARALVTRAVAACAELGPLRAVLAEAEWPDLLPPGQFPPSEVAAARADNLEATLAGVELASQITELELVTGYSPVQGPGAVVTLTDAPVTEVRS